MNVIVNLLTVTKARSEVLLDPRVAICELSKIDDHYWFVSSSQLCLVYVWTKLSIGEFCPNFHTDINLNEAVCVMIVLSIVSSVASSTSYFLHGLFTRTSLMSSDRSHTDFLNYQLYYTFIVNRLSSQLQARVFLRRY